ncbi:MAG: hypothetical protein H6713_13860 [Myxococcales bacterium]|nr:hypothetical protein [Myxococcales bacterium]
MHPLTLAALRRVLPAMAALATAGRDRDARARARDEARSKVEITALVADPRMREETGHESRPVSEQVAGCYRLGDFPALWAIEGLGLRLEARALAGGDGERGAWLTSAPLPASSLPMLHAGVGLALARAALARARSRRRAAVEAAARWFVERCRARGRDGYVGASLESLGLVARFFHGRRMVEALATTDALARADARAWLWHGAGRALYFAPRNGLPARGGATWSIGQCLREADGDVAAARELLAGNLWAIALVNARHPRVLEGILTRSGELLSEPEAAARGVASALTVRRRTTPRWPGLAALRDHAPVTAEARVRWELVIGAPARAAIDAPLDDLRIESLFRCGALDEHGARASEAPGQRDAARGRSDPDR